MTGLATETARCAKSTQPRIIQMLRGRRSTLPQFPHMARTMKTPGAILARGTLAGTPSPDMRKTGSKLERA